MEAGWLGYLAVILALGSCTVPATLTSQQFVNTTRYLLGTILFSLVSVSPASNSSASSFTAGGMTSGVPPAATDRTDTIGKIPAGSREIPHTNLEPSHSSSPTKWRRLGFPCCGPVVRLVQEIDTLECSSSQPDLPFPAPNVLPAKLAPAAINYDQFHCFPPLP